MKYSKQFKQDAVRLVTEQQYQIAEAARNLGINTNILGRWIKEYRSMPDEAFRGNGQLTTEQAEIHVLRKENKRLKMEREILKKSSGLLRERIEVRYAFIDSSKKAYLVTV